MGTPGYCPLFVCAIKKICAVWHGRRCVGSPVEGALNGATTGGRCPRSHIRFSAIRVAAADIGKTPKAARNAEYTALYIIRIAGGHISGSGLSGWLAENTRVAGGRHTAELQRGAETTGEGKDRMPDTTFTTFSEGVKPTAHYCCFTLLYFLLNFDN